MKSIRFWLIGLSLLSSLSLVKAQNVQWASKVLEYSSEYSDAANPRMRTAFQATGKPNVNPEVHNGDTDCAWYPNTATSSREEYIKLGYDKPMKVRQIAISECFNPGAIDRVLLFDSKGAAHEVYKNASPAALSTGSKARLLNIFIDSPEFMSNAVMIVLNTAAVSGYNAIDAVGISEGTDSIKVKINLATGVLTDGARENLGANINSPTDELLPVISPDGRSLYFTRQGHPGNMGNVQMQDIWVSKLQPDNSWGAAVNAGAPLNNGDNNAAAAITPDGNTLLLLNKYEPDGKMSKGISTSTRLGNQWEMPVACDIDSFYNDNVYGEYTLSASGKVMIMAIQRKDSRGNKDLYATFLQDNGHWSIPMHLGDSLNTAGGESTPYLAADETTLYFSTNGLPGYGSKDMYVTRRLDSTWTRWSSPQNLGPLLNTAGWDAYYSIPAKGDFAYFVSYTNSIGAADIFRAPLPQSVRPRPVVMVTGHVLNAKTNAPIRAKIVYESLTSGKELGIALSDPADGSYSIVLPAGEEYGFLAEANGYFPVSENIDLRKLTAYEEVKRDLKLVPLEVGNVARLNNLFFDTGKADLRSQSTKELKRLIKILEANPTMSIEIVGHTDDVGTDANNLELSKRRSASVRTFLIKNGIAEVRLTSKGMGESQPQVPNTTPENRQINRRVEFTILSI